MSGYGKAGGQEKTGADRGTTGYRGPSDEAFDENGKRIERSIYSRPWIDDESKEIPVTITLKGKWNVASHPAVKVLESDKKHTILQFTCREGKSYDVQLSK